MNDMQSLTQDIAEEVSSGANTLPLFFDKLSQALPLSKVLSAIVLLMVCMLVTKLLLRATNRILVHSRLEKSLHSFLRSVVKALLVFISIMVVAGALGINTSSLLAILSVAGLAVSLSIQNTLSNLAGGIMILLSKPFTQNWQPLTTALSMCPTAPSPQPALPTTLPRAAAELIWSSPHPMTVPSKRSRPR